ncbi:MAG: oligoendopeptidase F, partial [Alphaproteobacteria bacterium]|nr:oligoendopeptidase F [Alphaproteobacteria bacterium]
MSSLKSAISSDQCPNAADGLTGTGAALGNMPEWNLDDLYPGPASAEVKQDLDKCRAAAKELQANYQGKIVEIAADGAKLARAIKDYEDVAELMSRLGTFAGLYYAGDQSDPARSKFYGDTIEALTAISRNLIFVELELNQIDEKVLAKSMDVPALRHYKPWLDDLLKEKPYQLDERLEQLFTDKSQTSAGAWNRLFSDTMAALRFDVEGEAEPLSLEPTLNLLSDSKEARRKAGAEALAKTFQENIRVFTLIMNTLVKDKEISDQWRGFEDVADSRHLANRVEGPVVDALVEAVTEKYPSISHRYYKMKANWLGKEKMPHWDRNAPLPDKPERVISWPEAREMVLGAYGGFSPKMADVGPEHFVSWLEFDGFAEALCLHAHPQFVDLVGRQLALAAGKVH